MVDRTQFIGICKFRYFVRNLSQRFGMDCIAETLPTACYGSRKLTSFNYKDLVLTNPKSAKSLCPICSWCTIMHKSTNEMLFVFADAKHVLNAQPLSARVNFV